MEQLIQEVFDKLEDISCRIDDGTQTNTDIESMDMASKLFLELMRTMDSELLPRSDVHILYNVMCDFRTRLQNIKVAEEC